MRAFILTIFVLYAVALVLDVVLAIIAEAAGDGMKPSAVVRMIFTLGFMIWGGILLWGTQ